MLPALNLSGEFDILEKQVCSESKSYTHRPYSDGGKDEKRNEQGIHRAHPQIHRCKPDANKKPPLTGVRGNGGLGKTLLSLHLSLKKTTILR
jgi:hypothetical protein